ncbi:MAG: hypothetical protein PVH21_00980 [Myxococcales bacterium]
MNAQTRSADDLSEVDLTTTWPEASPAVLKRTQDQAFRRKQKRRLAVGWTLIGAGTALAVSSVWLSRSGGDPSAALKRSLAATIPGVAMVVAGGGVLIKRRMKKNEHDTATQLRVTLMSISVGRRF